MRFDRDLSHDFTTQFSDPGKARAIAEYRRMCHAAAEFASAHHHIADLGEDPLVAQLASARGFARHDLAISRVVSSRCLFTVVVVPKRISSDLEEMASVLSLVGEAKSLRTRCIVVHHGWLIARAPSSRAISRCRNIRVPDSDAISLLDHLADVGRSSIAACALAMNRHPDPYGAVLALAARGLIGVRRRGKLGPETPAWLASARVAAPGARP